MKIFKYANSIFLTIIVLLSVTWIWSGLYDLLENLFHINNPYALSYLLFTIIIIDFALTLSHEREE